MYRILLKVSDTQLQYYFKDGTIFETSSDEEVKSEYLNIIKTMPTDKVEITKVVTTELVVNINQLSNPVIVN